jgi:hypothetical protein
MKRKKTSTTTEMRANYDFTGGIRGVYAGRIWESRKLILLDSDVGHVFADSREVNETLRALIALAHQRVKKRGERGGKQQRARPAGAIRRRAK